MKFSLILSLSLSLSLSLASLTLQSQPWQAIQQTNDTLRSLFDSTSAPSSSGYKVNHFYDMVAHYIDSGWFFTNTDSSQFREIWFEHYYHMYYMARDTSVILSQDSMVTLADDYRPDTIGLGIMNYSFYCLKDTNVLTDTNYFYPDTINNIFKDNPNRTQSPYEIHEVFAPTTTYSQSYFRDVNFVVDPALFYVDSIHQSLYTSGNSFKVNFNNGSGWYTFQSDQKTAVTVTFPDTGTYEIVFHFTDDTDTLFSSKTRITILSNGTRTYPAPLGSGMNSFVYNNHFVGYFPPNCVYPPKEVKILIYVTGFDPMDGGSKEKSVTNFYGRLVKKKNLDQLQAFGYGIFIIDWVNSQDSVQTMADDLVEIISQIKCRYVGDYEFVIMSNSGGSPTTRYALSYMETLDYTNSEACEAADMHNTRLWITVDGPLNGANIPLGIQHLYEDDKAGVVLSIFAFKQRQKWNQYSIDSYGAKQLILYHHSTKSGNTYSSSALHTDLIEETENIKTNSRGFKGYPDYCKMMAISNGRLNGEGMENYNFTQPKQNSDRILDIDIDQDIRVLGYSLSLLDSDVLLKHNPSSSNTDTLYYRSATLRMWRPVITIDFSSSPYLKLDIIEQIIFQNSILREGTGLLDYTMAPGGSYNLHNPDLWSGLYKDRKVDLINNVLLGIQTNVQLSDVVFAATPGLSKFTGETDGFGFGFVPVHSAIDYKGTSAMDADLTSIPLNDLMDDTPFDMIVGEIPESYNTTHCAYINFVLDDTVSWGDDAYYLNREIGDEEHFYNNRKARPSSSYSVGGIGTVNMGLQNPYFNTTSQIPLSIEHPDYVNQSADANQSFFSASRNYNSDCTIPRISYTDTVTTNFLTGNTYDVQCSSYPATYTLFDPEFLPCYTNKRQEEFERITFQPEVLVFPNPTNSQISFSVPVRNLRLFNMVGDLVINHKLISSSFEINQPPGLYLLIYDYGIDQVGRSKIIVK